MLYCNKHTGTLIGEEVLAFYNLEMPELLTVCDMKRQSYFSVGRGIAGNECHERAA